MTCNIVGMMWNKNEGDILREIITAALRHVDLLYIADDGSADNSWGIIQDIANSTRTLIPQCCPDNKDPGQRTSLLDTIRSRHDPKDTWVQIIESDIMILDTDVREAIKTRAIGDIAVPWQTLNGVKLPGEWTEEEDTYPNWHKPITEVLSYAHRMETMVYTFRPLPDLYYHSGIWRPWPSGFSRYSKVPLDPSYKDGEAPLLAHYGFRGPTHFFSKYAKMGRRHRKYPTWDLTSRETILQTVPFFNGDWNGQAYPMNRDGWRNRNK